eukprot:6106837-Lingulodinium_polyedra.AAC.1
MPSAILVELYNLASRNPKFGGDEERVWGEVVENLAYTLQEQAKEHPDALYQYVDAIAETNFARKGYSYWLKKFRAYEVSGTTAKRLREL